MLSFDDLDAAIRYMTTPVATHHPDRYPQHCIITATVAQEFLARYSGGLAKLDFQLMRNSFDCPAGCDPQGAVHYTTVEDGAIDFPKGCTDEDRWGYAMDFVREFDLWQLWRK